MSEIDDGGPAFPWGEHGTHLGGASLRDYFASKALPALINEPLWDEGSRTTCFNILNQNHAFENNLSIADQYAVAAYILSDAMIKARNK